MGQPDFKVEKIEFSVTFAVMKLSLKIMRKSILISFLAVWHMVSVNAGWIIREATTFSDRDTKEKRIVYVEGNRIRMDEAGLTTIVNLNDGMIRFLDKKKKIYWEGTIHDYDREIIAGMRATFRKSVEDYSDSARELAEESFERMAADLVSDSSLVDRSLKVQVSQTRNGEKMFGYSTRVYMVWVNKVATEEVWVAPQVMILREPEMRKFWDIFNRITRYYEKGFHYQADPRYIYLMTRGYPLRVKEFGYRYDVITEVTSLKQKRMSDSRFSIPNGCREVPLSELKD